MLNISVLPPLRDIYQGDADPCHTFSYPCRNNPDFQLSDNKSILIRRDSQIKCKISRLYTN